MKGTIEEDPFTTIPAVSGTNPQERSSIKLVSCVVRPESLETVKVALDQLHVVGGMTITDVRGFGRQKGQVEHYRGETFTIRLLPKVKVEVVVRNDDVDRVMTTIGNAARTGQIGDGKIFVMDVQSAMRVRTGERGINVL